MACHKYQGEAGACNKYHTRVLRLPAPVPCITRLPVALLFLFCSCSFAVPVLFLFLFCSCSFAVLVLFLFLFCSCSVHHVCRISAREAASRQPLLPRLERLATGVAWRLG
jgi:hypothetical protein